MASFGWKSILLLLAVIPLFAVSERWVAHGGEPALPETALASDGRALQPVIVARNASEEVRESAETLADYLQQISGAKFLVKTGDGTTGLAVGRASRFPQLPSEDLWDAADPTRGEDYLLQSHREGVYLLGASELAVEHVVWDFLYRLGYRQFFPGDHWQVVPDKPELSIAVEAREHPDFLARRIWYGFGPWDYARQPYRRWCSRNRATSGIRLRTGHAYQGIFARNRQAFEEHPEYLGLVDGERTSSKFCISNAALRRLVVRDALARLEENPSADSISMDPSDGLGWCECADCQAMGSVSDRALQLANEVAAAVNKEHPGTYVGMYAYSAHSPPPNIRVHPRVVISVATAFIRGGYTVDELLDGWHEQGATLGIREYFSVHPWDRDLPGRPRASDLAYLRSKIPHFRRQGARFFSAESSDNWGPAGLGYYLAARMLWDIDKAERIEALVEDFLRKAFGPARETMQRFYELIDGANDPLLSDDLIGRMYRLLRKARRQADEAAIQKRLDDLVLYTRYVELFFDYAHAEGQQRQAAFEALIRHGYRMRKTMMIHAKALYRDVVRRDERIRIPEGAAWNVPESENPWKSSREFTPRELDRFVSAGIAEHKLRGLETVAFGSDLVPATPLDLPEKPTGNMGLYSRGKRTYFTWVESPPREITLQVKGGRIYQDRGDVVVVLRHGAKAAPKPLARATVPPDGEEHEITLSATKKGLHRIEVSDGSAGTEVDWPSDLPMTVESSRQSPARFHGRWSLYFYVPEGSEVVGGFASGPGRLLGGDGEVVYRFPKRPEYFSVPVEPGQDGRLWQFKHCAGRRLLMTVPPYLARRPEELLLPSGVVQKEAASPRP